MGTIAKVTAGGATHLIASTAYATCTTGSTTAAKVATIQDSQDFTLINGVTIHVLFDWGNSAEAPTLNVNNTGAKPIYRNASQVPDATYYWRKQSMVSLTYSTSKVSTGAWYLNDVSEGNADWIASTGPTSILNKPSIPSTYSDVGAASAAHAHGSVTSDGKITDTGVTIGSGDALVITDSSDSNKIKKSSITFGTSATSFLANNGTWVTPSVGESYTATSPISISGTDIQHINSGVTSGTYGLTYNDKTNGYYVPSFTIDSKGHITSATALGSALPAAETSIRYYANYTPLIGYNYLSAGATSSSYTFTDVYSQYPSVFDVKAIDSTTKEPVIVDWYANNTNSNSITVNVSIATAYEHQIWWIPVMKKTGM